VAHTKILDASRDEAIEEAAEVIRRGGLVAFPTETVYGLGADASNPIAVARIFEVKRRPAFDPVIVHIADPAAAALYGDFSSACAQSLIRRFWPGPLTIVVRKTEIVPPVVTAGLDTVAVRMPDHETAIALIRVSGRAIAAPSANPFGYVSPTEAAHVAALLTGVDLILDGGRCRVGVESSILSLAGAQPRLLRAGGAAPEDLERITGPLRWSTEAAARPDAPGQLSRHYATRTPLQIIGGQSLGDRVPGERIGLITLLPTLHPERFAAVEVLSSTGDLREAAANLFAALHRLDRLGLDRLIARPMPAVGLGVAIMDRLRRCSYPAAGVEGCGNNADAEPPPAEAGRFLVD